MGDTISDKELRKRLLSFNTVVPPITGSTRKLLLKKLAALESGRSDKNSSKIMPPPKPKTRSNGTNESIMISSSVNSRKQTQHLIFDIDSPRKSRRRVLDPYDTSDSEVDGSSLGRSIQPANPYITSSSPKSNETSLMNVSTITSKFDADKQNSYSSPETKQVTNKQSKTATNLLNSTVNKIPTESYTRKLRSSPPAKTVSNADLAIQRWKEKLQSHNEYNVLNTSTFPSPISKASSQNLRKNIVFPQLRYPGSYYSKYTQSTILFFIGFFVVIFGLYFISLQSNTTVLPSSVLNSWCAKNNVPKGHKCDEEQEKIQRIFNSVVSLIQEKYVKNQCDKSDVEPTVNAQTVYEYISTRENLAARQIEEIVELFKRIAKTNSDLPISFDTSFKINTQPNLPPMCAAKNMFSNMFYLSIWVVIVVLSVAGLYFVICYISTKNENYKQEVNKLIESTIELLKEQALNKPNENYLPIIYIRDHLIPFDERQSKSKMWAEVVQYFTESESSVRSEIREIDGEDYQVWKLFGPTSPCVSRIE